jgi:hypothetical protein
LNANQKASTTTPSSFSNGTPQLRDSARQTGTAFTQPAIRQTPNMNNVPYYPPGKEKKRKEKKRKEKKRKEEKYKSIEIDKKRCFFFIKTSHLYGS